MNGVEIGAKLRLFIKSKGLKQETFAEKVGATRPYITKVLSGKGTIGINLANRMQEVFGISAGWLLTGEGSMMVDGTDGQPDEEKPKHEEPSPGMVSVSEAQLDALARTVSTMERNAADLMRQNELLMQQNEMLTKNLALVTEQLEAAVAMLKARG